MIIAIIIIIVLLGYIYISSTTNKDTRTGEWREYHSNNGVLKRIGNYELGKMSGEWKTYYHNGSLHEISNYKNDILDGDYVEFSSNEIIERKGTYVKGLKDGKWQGKGLDYEYTCEYINGNRNGEYRVIFNSGQPKVIGYYKFDKTVGIWQTYNENGTIQKIEEFNNVGNKTGTWKYFYPNSELKEERSYVNQNEYSVKEYFDNGKLKSYGHISDFGHRKDSVGHWKFYYENGNLKKEGNFASSDSFKNSIGNPDGNWKLYHENGNLESEGTFGRSWKKIGLWNFFNHTGEIIKTESYN